MVTWSKRTTTSSLTQVLLSGLGAGFLATAGFFAAAGFFAGAAVFFSAAGFSAMLSGSAESAGFAEPAPSSAKEPAAGAFSSGTDATAGFFATCSQSRSFCTADMGVLVSLLEDIGHILCKSLAHYQHEHEAHGEHRQKAQAHGRVFPNPDLVHQGRPVDLPEEGDGIE